MQEGFSSSFYFFFLSVETGCIHKERAAEEVRPMSFHTSRWIRTNKYFFFFLFLFSSFHLESIETLHILLLCTAWIPSTTHFSPTFSTWLSHIAAILRCTDSLFLLLLVFWFFVSIMWCTNRLKRSDVFLSKYIVNVLFGLKQRCQFKLRIDDVLWSVLTLYSLPCSLRDLPLLGYTIWGTDR